jgi:LmbE family N-acetylglucosaminyl deacetylase
MHEVTMKLRLLSFACLVLLAGSASRAGNRNVWPLPEDRGTAGILAALQKLPVYVRVLHTTAHPDDESAGTLTWLARKVHARTALFSLTRGEGGQNVLGKEQYEAMGLLRTGELLEACRHYGVELYFSTAFDFGFSKSPDEALAKWGREETLEEMVRFIRTWRPAIIISKFQGTAADGHGHHQAAGIISHEAFRAAGDPEKFPEQSKYGLQPWQARKLYMDATRPPGEPNSGTRAETAWNVRVPVGDFDPVLGRSYREISSEGYSKHRSQGNATTTALPGSAYDYYRLVDSTVGSKPKEDSFFDGIDTSLPAILELAGSDQSAASLLRNDLVAAQQSGEEALKSFDLVHPEHSAAAAVRGVAVLQQALRKLTESQLPLPAKTILGDALREKLNDFYEAVNAVLGIYLVARSDNATLVPGQKENLTAYFYNRGTQRVRLSRTEVTGWLATQPSETSQDEIGGGESRTLKFSVAPPSTAEPTQLHWTRAGKADARYRAPAQEMFVPFGKPEVSVQTAYRYQDVEIAVSAPARAAAGDPLKGADFVDLQVVPQLSVRLTPEIGIVALSKQSSSREFLVAVSNNAPEGTRATVTIRAPKGWRVDPPEIPFNLSRKGESFSGRFVATVPAGTPAGTFTLEAAAIAADREYRSGYRVISYPENWTRNFYSAARAEVELFDVKISPRLKVGYVMGAGDEVPDSFGQLGIKPDLLSGFDLAFGDLSQYSTIVTGIRAYNVNEDLKTHNQRLLKYVEQGGVLIVQYNTPMRSGPPGRNEGAPFPYAPYPLALAPSDRITVEDSPLEILAPQDPILTSPNKITPADFQGWVQERGLYFARQWDSHYTPLFSGHDPGEPPQKGGMLVAKYGNGYYIYTAYAWFRQLPAGNPGAFRIFANMLSVGKPLAHNKK